jgi:hypothetical protein
MAQSYSDIGICQAGENQAGRYPSPSHGAELPDDHDPPGCGNELSLLYVGALLALALARPSALSVDGWRVRRLATQAHWGQDERHLNQHDAPALS